MASTVGGVSTGFLGRKAVAIWLGKTGGGIRGSKGGIVLKISDPSPTASSGGKADDEVAAENSANEDVNGCFGFFRSSYSRMASRSFSSNKSKEAEIGKAMPVW